MLKNLLSMSSLNLVKAFVQFGISTLVAVYVVPARYGLITFSLPIIQFIALFTDMGLASAVIRQPAVSREDAGAAISFTVAVALVAAALLAGTAWPIERWSGLPGLAPVLAALAAAVFFSIVAGVPRALLERALRYQRVATIEAVALAIAASVCVAAVVAGAGIWAMIGFHVTLQSARALGFLSATRGGYAINHRWRSVGMLLSFGGWVLATNLVNFFGRNAQNILIGAWLGAAAVGLYGLAYQFMLVPLMALAWPASGVLMATLSRVDGSDAADYRQPVLAISSVTAMLAFPTMVYMVFGLAWPIRQLLSPHWVALIPLLATLAPLGAIQALASYNGAVLIARGHARVQFWVNVVSTAALLVGFVAALPFGLRAFAWAYLGVGAAVALGQIGAKLWAARLGWGAYGSALAPAAIATGAGVAVAAMVGFTPGSWPMWALTTFAYGGTVLIVLALFKRQVISAIRSLLGVSATGMSTDLSTTGQPAAG